MSNDLEQRLEAMLAEAPDPDPGAGEEALQRALHALQPAAAPHRGLRAGVLAFAAIVVLLVIAAGSLGAVGALHVSFGTKPKPRPAPPQLTLPKVADGVAAIVDGRLYTVTRGGGRVLVPATAAALSPHALFVAAGLGDSLVAIAPNGRHAWAHPTAGQVVAIAWAPDGYRIAYVVHTEHRFVLHTIYGNGINDRTIDRSVRAVTPSWRADSLAVAYVGGGGRPVVYDVGHRKHTVLGATTPVTRLAFAPAGEKLAVATPDAVVVEGRTVATGDVEALGWLDGHVAAAIGSRTLPFVRSFGHGGRLLDDFRVPGTVIGFSGGLVVTRTEDRILAGWGRTKTVNALLKVRRTTTVQDVAIG